MTAFFKADSVCKLNPLRNDADVRHTLSGVSGRSVADVHASEFQYPDGLLNAPLLRLLADACPPARDVKGGSVPHVLYLAARCECGASYFGAACPMCPAQPERKP